MSAVALNPLRKPPQPEADAPQPNPCERGQLTEITGSAGRTTLAQTGLAAATRRGEICALIDGSNAWNPEAAVAQGADLQRILWVRCRGDWNKAMQATDLILRAGGFGVVWLDLDAIAARTLSRIPVAHWYRFRRAVENTDTALVVLARQASAGAAAHRRLQCEATGATWTGGLLHTLSFRIEPQKDFRARPVEVTAQAG